MRMWKRPHQHMIERRISPMSVFRIYRLTAALICLLLIFARLDTTGAMAASTTISSKDFATECNTSLSFTIDTDTIVTGSAGTLSAGSCWVHLAPGVSLTFDRAALNSPEGSDIGLTIDVGDASQIHVYQSTIVLGGLFLE